MNLRTLLSLVLVLAPCAVSAAPKASRRDPGRLRDRIAAVAASAGASLPEAAEAEPVPLPIETVAYRTGRVDGSGRVTGSGYVHCVGSSMTGSVRFSGDIDVRGDDGVHGSIQVSGTAFVSGMCHNGMGTASVNVEVDGSGPVRDREGHTVGTARVSGRIWSASVRPGSVFMSEHVRVDGWY